MSLLQGLIYGLGVGASQGLGGYNEAMERAKREAAQRAQMQFQQQGLENKQRYYTNKIGFEEARLKADAEAKRLDRDQKATLARDANASREKAARIHASTAGIPATIRANADRQADYDYELGDLERKSRTLPSEEASPQVAARFPAPPQTWEQQRAAQLRGQGAQPRMRRPAAQGTLTPSDRDRFRTLDLLKAQYGRLEAAHIRARQDGNPDEMTWTQDQMQKVAGVLAEHGIQVGGGGAPLAAGGGSSLRDLARRDPNAAAAEIRRIAQSSGRSEDEVAAEIMGR